jgi:hypothetical protein
LGRYLRELGLINRVSQKGISRLGMSGIGRNGKKSGDCCQCDNVRDFGGGDMFIHKVIMVFAVVLPAPDSPLESVQQFFSTLRLTSGITQQPGQSFRRFG